MSRGPARPGWTKVLVSCEEAAADEVSAFLAELTGRGTETLAADDGGTLVAGYLPRGPAGDELLGTLQSFLGDLDRWGARHPRLAGTEEEEEEDWLESWKSRFDVTRLTGRLTVRPSWKRHDPGPGEKVIDMDPAMAFGTGLHESTRLVLRFIEDLYPAGAAGPRRVLDVGTGTGILAMAAALLGAESVLAVDNDPLAVEAAGENVSKNGLADKVTVSDDELGSVPGRFDLITANIVHDVLLDMAPALAERLAVGGSIVCAGILAGGQARSLTRAFEGLGLRVAGKKSEKEWAALEVKF